MSHMKSPLVEGKFIGRKSAGAGAAEECLTAEVLEEIGTCARGDILFRGLRLGKDLQLVARVRV